MSRAGKKLSDEDRVLWNLVARSATPLKGKQPVEEKTPGPAVEKLPKAMAAPATIATMPAAPKRQHVAHVLDRPTLDKLARGRLPIEGRVDLHGMTQSEAHALLLSFLQRAHASGVRYVLVITGKGMSSGGDGVLRRQVPAWLSTPPFRALVSSHDLAARNHGGEGALYIRLRRSA
ncbi:MAG: Smr/MutS family protein [Pseudomonadota bacterium]|nr:Smr/MutS family protein [Pseudomonadota bacterium]